jgi:hypothetical protein
VKRFGKDLVKTVRQSDWFDWLYLSYIVGAGVVFAAVMNLLMDEFRP